jgi:hypothetical protein
VATPINKRPGARVFGLIAAAFAALVVAVPTAGAAGSGAGFTTTNAAVDGAGHCLNGPGTVNCNIYDGKEFVWLNGGPQGARLAPGDYFFAVLTPGGQPDPNDGGAKNLSVDTRADRTFHIDASGDVSTTGTHQLANGLIRLAPYADTTNDGRVYILAICALPDDGGRGNPSTCKYDAFKVRKANGVPAASDLVVTKDATATFERAFEWNIAKDADKSVVKQVGGSATFTYTVGVDHDAGVDRAWKVTGTITVANHNTFDVPGVSVTDAIDDPSADCAVIGGTNATILAEDEATFAYSCAYSQAPATASETNTATATWDAVGDPSKGGLAAGSANFQLPFDFPAEPMRLVDDCVTVTDTNVTGPLGGACVGTGAFPRQFTYSKTFAVPQAGCQSFGNTAAFITNTTGTTRSADKTVTVCGPARTGALTMGFWQNKNGQGLITGQAAKGACPSAAGLRQYAPFQDLGATATCAQVATYVTNVIKAALCTSTTNTCNSMLKAQMLATALDVYFGGGPGGNPLGAPTPVGGVAIDLTRVCPNIATCSTFEDVGGAFGGARGMTVSEMLASAASQSNVGGTVWYGQVKATQALAKDAFDAINNQVAFGA